MRELLRTNDVVLVSAVGALLDGANIHHLVLDQNMSILEGSVGVIPRRILVHEDDATEARQVLTDAGLANIAGLSLCSRFSMMTKARAVRVFSSNSGAM